MLILRVSEPETIALGLGAENDAILEVEPAVYVSIADYYEGPYTVTPGTEAVTLETDGLTMSGDVTVQAVPVGSEGVPVATKGAVSNHQIAVTPSVTNAAGLIEGGTRTGAPVTVSASELVSGTKNISANGSGIDVVDFEAVNVAVPNTYTAQDEGKVVSSGSLVPQTSATYTQNGAYNTTLIKNVTVAVPPPALQSKSRTYAPTETDLAETLTADSGYDGIGEVEITVSAIPSDYVGSGIPRRDSSNMTASGATVTAPAGYYSAAASKSVASGTAGTPTASKGTVSNHAVTVTPSVTNTAGYIPSGTRTGAGVSVSASELVSGTKSITANGSGIDVTEYAAVDVAVPGSAPSLQTKTATYTPSTSAITDTITPDAGYDGMDEVDVTVDAIPPATVNIGAGTQYVTTGSVRKWEVTPFVQELPGNGGFMEMEPFERIDGTTAVYNAVQSGTTVTPSTAPQTIGGANYMMEGAVTVNAMPSGTEGTPTATKSAVSNHALTVTPSVTNGAGYISGGTHSGTAVSVTAAELVSGTYNVTSSGTKDVTNYASASIPAGSATPAANISGTSATVSTGTNTLTLTKTVSNTPQVTAGYVASGTAGNSSVSLTANVTTKGTATITPGTTNQTISSGTYITGAQTISGDANLVAGNIKSGITIFGVTGTYSGGGGSSKNAQVVQQGNTRIASTTYSKACGDITVSKTGTYDVYWTAYRTSTSGTWGTQLYISGVAYGSAQATFSSYYQTVHLSNVSLTANQTVAVYGRSRGSNYYLYVGQLTIIEA